MSYEAYQEQIAWLERAHTLHRQVDILYVVDGYEVTVTYDENHVSKSFHGESLFMALEAAMEGFDLEASFAPTGEPKKYPLDVQHEVAVKALDELANGYAGNDWDVGISERLRKARALLKELKA